MSRFNKGYVAEPKAAHKPRDPPTVPWSGQASGSAPWLAQSSRWSLTVNLRVPPLLIRSGKGRAHSVTTDEDSPFTFSKPISHHLTFRLHDHLRDSPGRGLHEPRCEARVSPR